MNVRIAYGVELDSVPDKVADMLEEFNPTEPSQLIDICGQLLRIDPANSETVSALIDQARQSLASEDRILQDAQAILNGFINAANSEEPPPPGGTNNVD
jgi:hypothetical protein